MPVYEEVILIIQAMLKTLLIIFLVTLAVGSVGWKRFIYFFSLGYGYGIAAIAITLAVLYWHALTWYTGAMLFLLWLYGVRLATYLLIREMRSAAYVKTVAWDEVNKEMRSTGVICIVWVSCVLLYICQTFPMTIQLHNASQGIPANPVWTYVGIGFVAVGFLMEAIADKQKSEAKKINAKRFVDTGLYRFVRCPNYLGEILLWTGVFASGIGSYLTWWHWVLACIGYAGIVYVMFSGARRLELRQDHNYSADPEYQAYKKRVPILLPFIPLYSVTKYKWLQA